MFYTSPGRLSELSRWIRHDCKRAFFLHRISEIPVNNCSSSINIFQVNHTKTTQEVRLTSQIHNTDEKRKSKRLSLMHRHALVSNRVALMCLRNGKLKSRLARRHIEKNQLLDTHRWCQLISNEMVWFEFDTWFQSGQVRHRLEEKTTIRVSIERARSSYLSIDKDLDERQRPREEFEWLWERLPRTMYHLSVSCSSSPKTISTSFPTTSLRKMSIVSFGQNSSCWFVVRGYA